MMATFVDLSLPNPAPSYFSQRTVLAGIELYLEFGWNTLAGRWYLTICDATESPIVSGIKLVTGTIMTRRVRDERFPVVGDLMLVGAIPTLETLGDGSHSLTFVDYTVDNANP